MDPVIGAALIGAGSSLVGGALSTGVFGSKGNKYDEQVAENRKILKNQIKWRVYDANQSGVHPLFALGANPAGFSPSPMMDSGDADMGNAIANAGEQISRGMLTKEQRVLDQLQMDLLRSQIQSSDADTMLKHAQAARERNEAFRASNPWVRPTDSIDPISSAVIRPVQAEEAFLTPQVLDQYGTAARVPGQNEMWQSYVVKDGLALDLPSQQASQSLESVGESFALQLMVLQRNLEKHPNRKDEILNLFAGYPQFKEAVKVIKDVLGSSNALTLPLKAGAAMVRPWTK